MLSGDSSTAHKPRHVRMNNSKAIMMIIRDYPMITIGEIVQKLNLSKTTVAKIVLNLVNQGLVISNGKGDSTEEGGKKPELFSLNTRYKYGLAVGLETSHIVCSLFDMGGNLCRHSEYIIENDAAFTYQQAMDVTISLCSKLIEEEEIGKDMIFGAVIYAGGIIDGEHGILRYPIRHPHWGNDLPLRRDFQEAFGLDIAVFVDNGTRFAGYTELAGPAGRNYSSCVVLFSNPDFPGVGGCVISHQQILRGDNSFIGEFGHMVVDPHASEQCICGNYGCFEMAVSPVAMRNHLRRDISDYPESSLNILLGGETINIGDIFSAADAGDKFARIIVDKIVYYYSLCIRNIIVSNDPEAIIIQGLPTGDESYFAISLQEKVRTIPFFGLIQRAKIRMSHINGTTLELFHQGAALYACNEYLNEDTVYRND